MPELIIPTKYYICDECNKGEMKWDGQEVHMFGRGYIYGHKCDNCNHTMTFDWYYPYPTGEYIAVPREETKTSN